MTVTEHRSRSMASAVQVILVDPAHGAHDYAVRRLQELESRWSRFLPESDVSRLNASPEALIIVSPDTVRLVAAMRNAWQITYHRYDPAMLSEIRALGYTRSIAAPSVNENRKISQGQDLDGTSASPATHASPASAGRATRRLSCGGSIEDVTIDLATSTVRLPAGVGLDPGGIGKGLAADLIVTELLERGTGGALVSIGGDLAAAGTAPSSFDGPAPAAGAEHDIGHPSGVWHVAIEHPLDPSRELMRLALASGGIATSSTQSRTWIQDGAHRHHVIDPATGDCATTDLAAVTVIARAGWEAEIHATAALLCGSARALDYLNDHDLSGVVMSLDGSVAMSPDLERNTTCISA